MNGKIKKQTAEQVFIEKSFQIEEEFLKLKTKLLIHRKKFENDKKNWGYAEDLNKILFDLKETNSFLN